MGLSHPCNSIRGESSTSNDLNLQESMSMASPNNTFSRKDSFRIQGCCEQYAILGSKTCGKCGIINWKVSIPGHRTHGPLMDSWPFPSIYIHIPFIYTSLISSSLWASPLATHGSSPSSPAHLSQNALKQRGLSTADLSGLSLVIQRKPCHSSNIINIHHFGSNCQRIRNSNRWNLDQINTIAKTWENPCKWGAEKPDLSKYWYH